MDPYTLHQMQQAGAFDAPQADDPADLLELLLDQFVRTTAGQQVVSTPAYRNVLVQFLEESRRYLQANPVVGQGMSSGGLTLVFQEGENVPLALPAETRTPARPEPIYAVTQPKERRMRGMPIDNSNVIEITGRDPRSRR